MEKILIVLGRGLEQPERVTKTLKLARDSKEQGLDVTVYLTDNGVLLVKKDLHDEIKSIVGEKALEYLSFLIEKKVPIYLCSVCARHRRLSESEILETASFAQKRNIIQLYMESKVFKC